MAAKSNDKPNYQWSHNENCQNQTNKGTQWVEIRIEGLQRPISNFRQANLSIKPNSSVVHVWFYITNPSNCIHENRILFNYLLKEFLGSLVTLL